MTIEKIIGCILCKTSIQEVHSHNAEPLASGRCCEDCNNEEVIPARISDLKVSQQ